MSLADLIKTLKAATRPEAVFGALSGDVPEALTESFRLLARVTHPDKNPGDETNANEAFKLLGEWHSRAKTKVANGTYGASPTFEPVTLRTKTATYTLTGEVAKGSISDVYRGEDQSKRNVIVKIVRSKSNNDLMLAEEATLKAIRSNLVGKHDTLLTHVPDLLDSFVIGDVRSGRRVNVFRAPRYDATLVTLADVIAAYPNGVDPKDAAWMFNRLLDGLSVAHAAGYVHGAVVPTNVLVDPESHFGIIVDWCYSVKSGQKVKAIEAPYRKHYPTEILRKEYARPCSDVFMAASTMVAITGGNPLTKRIGDSVPAHIANLLRACFLMSSNRIQNAIDLKHDFSEALTATWGKRKFHEFKMPKTK